MATLLWAFDSRTMKLGTPKYGVWYEPTGALSVASLRPVPSAAARSERGEGQAWKGSCPGLRLGCTALKQAFWRET